MYHFLYNESLWSGCIVLSRTWNVPNFVHSLLVSVVGRVQRYPSRQGHGLIPHRDRHKPPTGGDVVRNARHVHVIQDACVHWISKVDHVKVARSTLRVKDRMHRFTKIRSGGGVV